MKRTQSIVAIVLSLQLLACEEIKRSLDLAEPATGPRSEELDTPPDDVVEAPSGPGSLRVTVRLAGTPPVAGLLDRKRDGYCAKTEKTDPSVLAKGGRLQNVVVGIASEVEGEFAPPTKPVVLWATECMYEPRVSVGMVGQALHIENKDRTMFRVHAYHGENGKTWFNQAQPPNAPPVKNRLGSAGLVRIGCDMHTYMRGWVWVATHPFQGVSGDDGVVTLADVPVRAEPYKVVAWHEILGRQEVDVKVEPAMTHDITITFEKK